VNAGMFFKAMLIGLSIAAPVGPIGLLCIQRTLAHGAGVGFVSGLGAATADGFYGAVGAFGLAAITHFFVALRLPLALGGAGLLGWMGIQMLRAAAPSRAAQAADPMGYAQAYGSVALLTLANPMTIMSFVAVFAVLGGRSGVDSSSGGVMVAGVFLGSAVWWLSLALGVHAVRQRIGAATMRWINRLAGSLLIAFAAWQLGKAI